MILNRTCKMRVPRGFCRSASHRQDIDFTSNLSPWPKERNAICHVSVATCSQREIFSVPHPAVLIALGSLHDGPHCESQRCMTPVFPFLSIRFVGDRREIQLLLSKEERRMRSISLSINGKQSDECTPDRKMTVVTT